MYFILTHGWGKNPDHYINIEYKNYNEAKKALSFLFDIYQNQLENGLATNGTFVCILKTKGVVNNGTDQETKKRKNK